MAHIIKLQHFTHVILLHLLHLILVLIHHSGIGYNGMNRSEPVCRLIVPSHGLSERFFVLKINLPHLLNNTDLGIWIKVNVPDSPFIVIAVTVRCDNLWNHKTIGVTGEFDINCKRCCHNYSDLSLPHYRFRVLHFHDLE